MTIARKKKVLITAALPYANGELHFGHIAGAYLPADCFARFSRMQEDKEVLFLCGSDEHGFAITISAEQAGRTPQEHVDFYHHRNEQLFQSLFFSFDYYGRTSAKVHHELSQNFFLQLLAHGHITQEETEQLYSEQQQRFLADRYVIGCCPHCGFSQARGDECQSCAASYEATDLIEPRAKLSNEPLITRKTTHWFLHFEHFREALSDWIEKKNWKTNVLQFAKNYINDLKPRAITRDSSWGIPVPLSGAEGKTLYVWFDAPIGYISMAQAWAERQGNKELWKDFWLDSQTQLVQFIGKDNIPFHAVFFPAMLLGQVGANKPSYTMVDDLPANEFLQCSGKKYSKSDGAFTSFDEALIYFTADELRYLVAANAPEHHDANFSWQETIARYESDLVNTWGNLVNRTFVLISKWKELAPQKEENRSGSSFLVAAQQELLDHCRDLLGKAHRHYEQFSLRGACRTLMELAHYGNLFLDTHKPWKLINEAWHDAEVVLSSLLFLIKDLAIIAYPILPNIAKQLWEVLSLDHRLEDLFWLQAAQEPVFITRNLPDSLRLFPKKEEGILEKLTPTAEVETVAKSAPIDPMKPKISFDHFKEIDLRTGSIIAVDPIPKSKKLLRLTIDLGFAVHTIVSGIALYFPESHLLVGKTVVVIANLEPVTFMGIESQGMLLAVENGEGSLQLLEIDKGVAGAVIS